jgi:hypothetical protein
MLTRANFLVRPAAGLRVLVAGAVFLACAASARAQGAQTDARWEAWLGCWTPASTLIRAIGRAQTSVVCVVPGSSASAVEVLTVSGGKVIDRTHVDTDGRQHPLTKEGCTGWQSAKWSPSARRVYLKSEFTCKGALATHVSALYAMAGSGEWVDVQDLRVDKNVGVHAIRYRQATDPGPLPAEIAQKLPPRSLARSAAMLAASSAPSLKDIEEASRALDPSVVSTWLIQVDEVTMEKPAPVNATQLAQLADAGVPASVIDVVVGLSYPKVLAVNPVNYGQVARQGSDSAYSQYGRYDEYGVAGPYLPTQPAIGFDRFGDPIYAGGAGYLNDCAAFGYGAYDLGWNSMYPQLGCGYGYAPYLGFGGYPLYGGYGGGYYGGGYYGGGYYGTPVVVPKGTGSSPGTMSAHGHVVYGHGYSRGGNGSNGTAMPRGDNGSDRTAMPRGGGMPSASASPPPARTAQPKKP